MLAFNGISSVLLVKIKIKKQENLLILVKIILF